MSVQTSQEVRRTRAPVNSWPPSLQGCQPQNATLPEIKFPPQSERPCYRAYKDPFKVTGDSQDRFYRAGIYHHFVHEDQDDDGNPTFTLIDYWFISWLLVLAIVRTANGKEHGYLIEYIAHGETETRRLVLPQSSLLRRADEAFKLLRSHGISVLNEHLKTIRQYLDQQHLCFSAKNPDDFWTSTRTIGWHSDKSFVLPSQIIGEQTGVCFSGNGDGPLYEKVGSFNDWQRHLATPCKGNNYLILAMSSSFTGPLLKWLGLTALGIHFYGDSTVGKSTAQHVGISSWAPPSSLLPWRATGNGLEGQAACRCDTFFALDDSHQIETKVLDLAIYMLGNGTSKLRMNRDSTPKEVQLWRLFILSSGERSLEIQLSAAHRA
jgi:putative DNA primase/helicase